MTDVKAARKTALLVVDAQESFKARGDAFWESGGPKDFEDNIKSLVTGFRKLGQPIYFILHTDKDPGFSTDSPFFRVMDFLEYGPKEPLLIKHVHNSFTGTNLMPMLIRDGITRVVICGIRTEQCCETTARVASDLGFEVDYVTQATLTFPLSHPFTGEKMTVEQIQSRTEIVLHKRFASIATVEQVLQTIQEAD
jgi:nicotinamidase-related amidase